MLAGSVECGSWQRENLASLCQDLDSTPSTRKKEGWAHDVDIQLLRHKIEKRNQ